MRRAGNFWIAGVSALFVCGAFGACTYNFDTLVAQTGPGGSGGTGGAAGIGGSSGVAGSSDDGGGTGGTGDDGSAGAGGTAGVGGGAGTGGAGGGTGGTSGSDASTDGGKGGTTGTDAGKGGTAGADAGADRIADVRTEPVPFDCNAVGGTTFQGRCYYPSSTPVPWQTANDAGCASPSHLVVIMSQAEQNVVAGILPNTQRWIGLRRNPGSPNMESSFLWVTAEAITFKTWEVYDTGAPEPNYTGDCVRMQPSGRWGDTNCAEMYAAICERE